MKRIPVRALYFALAFALLLSACAAPLAQQNGSNSTPAANDAVGMEGMQASPEVGMPATGEEMDALFIDMMVPHHEGAVAMAEIALERSQRPEVLEMANAILASQAGEIERMKAWKLEWYGTSDTPPMSEMPMLQEMEGQSGGHPMDMEADVAALRSAGEPFDLAFIDAMIPHHQSAIDAAQLVVEAAAHPELRELAREVIDAQQQEIDALTQWRAQWFPDAPPPASAAH